MSALSEASTPAQETAPPSIDAHQLHNLHQDNHQNNNSSSNNNDSQRKPKAPSVRRACVACHTGKTRCSEVLPCQSCIKRGLGATCAYPDPDAPDHSTAHQTSAPPVPTFAPPPMFPQVHGTPTLSHQQYYDYNGTLTGASTSTFRPNKRSRNLTEEEAAAITRNFTRGDFYVGSSAPVRIDTRLTVRLTLGEGDHVHFIIGETVV